MELTLEPAHRLMWMRDVFGNSIALVDWLEPSDVLTIVNDVIVERLAPFPDCGHRTQPWRVPFPPQYDPLESGDHRRVYQLAVLPRKTRRRCRHGCVGADGESGRCGGHDARAVSAGVPNGSDTGAVPKKACRRPRERWSR